ERAAAIPCLCVAGHPGGRCVSHECTVAKRKIGERRRARHHRFPGHAVAAPLHRPRVTPSPGHDEKAIAERDPATRVFRMVAVEHPLEAALVVVDRMVVGPRSTTVAREGGAPEMTLGNEGRDLPWRSDGPIHLSAAFD